MIRARLVGQPVPRLTPPRRGEPEAVAVPPEDGVGFLVLPDGAQYPETISRRWSG